FFERVKPKSNSLTLTVVFCGFAHGAPVGPVGSATGLAAGAAAPVAAAGVATTLTPMPSWPFMPAPACPGTVHRYSYLPVFESLTVRLCDCPGLSILVPLPLQLFALMDGLGVRQIWKLWVIVPLFVTLKVTSPAGRAETFESLMPSS